MGKKGSFELTTITSTVATTIPPSSGQVETQTEGDPNTPARVQWDHKAEFVLSCISMSVGLGNVWRFPYLAYSNGGGAFLLPYLIILFLCGRPMYFMEMAFGQYHQEGPVTIWKKVSPIGRGIGIAQCIIQAMISMYYVVIMAWTSYYFWVTLISAFKGEDVPWGDHFCHNEWAHYETCVPVNYVNQTDISVMSPYVPVLEFFNGTEIKEKKYSVSQQYYDRVILQKYKKGDTKSYGLGDMGDVNWILLANLAGSWVVIFFTLVKGIKTAGKVVYVTSTLPFIVLFIILGRGASLEGAADGIKYFIYPQFDKLLDVETWRNAAEQMFYSLSVGFGALVMLGSYNKRNNNCYQDAMIVSVADTATSVISGVAMFSVLGYLARQMNVGIDVVAEEGPGLAFVTFPEAFNRMPVPHLWSILFFVMLYTIGLGSEIGALETVLTIFYDEWPKLREKKPMVCGLTCFVCFLVGIPFVTQGGVEIFLIFDSYAGGFSVLFPALLELMILAWVYGLRRFLDDIEGMLDRKFNIYWTSTWGLLAPLTVIIVLVMSFAFYTPLNHGGDLPAFADGLGWVLAMVSIIQLPIWAIVAVYQAKGNTLAEKFHQSLWPDEIMEGYTANAVTTDFTFSSVKLHENGGPNLYMYDNEGYDGKK
ncbi:hypothetical protein RvY_16205 [Ramazzottius varieornatus]|uniref:Transporter n=1 Tax=Ramazzottius varieornatus TaxID=947166 RepID=A0A1D1W226_RAMVA|nr:hypothetical protein RvY_16205 [Ramazzottius varieornatus]